VSTTQEVVGALQMVSKPTCEHELLLDLSKIDPAREPDPNLPENLDFEHNFLDPNSKYIKPEKLVNFSSKLTRTRPINPNIISFILKFFKIFALSNTRNSLYQIILRDFI